MNTGSKLREPPSLASGRTIKAVDLFCGAGGLTHGLERAGITVALGVDVDPACEFPYSANNSARFLRKSIKKLNASDFEDTFDEGNISLLAGCAPCQPFSTYSKGRFDSSDSRWGLLYRFMDWVEILRPDLVTMENVPGLAKNEVFKDFVDDLKRLDYHVSHKIVNCVDYGIPQTRRRLVLLASRFGPIELIEPTQASDKRITVRDTIGELPPIKAGEIWMEDPLHQSCGLSPINLKRIKASKPGGSWQDWDEELVAACHRKASGQSYGSVYGRMSWDQPGPTITTQFCGFGNGRFGHPEQHRAISLREGALFQGFPRDYQFAPEKETICRKNVGRLIGNAVPVKLAEIIGKSMIAHIDNQNISQ